jgi:hypothetical protein
MLLNMGMSGLGYHNSDIGGFCCGTTTPELYVRWMQYGTFCPITRAHGTGQPTEPWGYGPLAEQISKQYIQLRYRLLPYIYTLAYENHQTGMPLARPLIFDDASDLRLYNESSAFLLGDALLVSPVVNAGQATKSVYLPRGRWVNFWTDEVYLGGQSITVATPLEIMPLFIKSGSIIPMQGIMNYTDERLLDTLMLRIYPAPGTEGGFALYEDDGKTLEYQAGSYGKTAFTQSVSNSGTITTLTIDIGMTEGTYTGRPQHRVYLSEVHGITGRPSIVRKNGMSLPERFSLMELRQGGDGFFYDPLQNQMFIQALTVPDSSYRLIAENVALSAGQNSPHMFEGFNLEYNFPNPFNPNTTIRYTIPREVRVRLRIYDVLGREVATLVDESKPAGIYEVIFSAAVTVRGSANDDIGGRSSGVYFCTLTAGDFSRTLKMVLVK